MPKDRDEQLAESRRSIRAALHVQREDIATRLAPATDDRARFPRSMIMRMLIQRPGIPAGWLAATLRSRFGGSLVAMLTVAVALHAVLVARTAARRPAVAGRPGPRT